MVHAYTICRTFVYCRVLKNFCAKLYHTLTDAPESGENDSAIHQNAPANFFRLLTARTLSKIGDRLSSPKTTLAWLLQSLGAPPIFTGLLVPLRESGSLLPQTVLSNYLKRHAQRKWAWSLGALVQGTAIAGCALVAVTLEGTAAGIGIVGCIAVFSLARGISSVSAKDVLGKTIPKSKRGQLTGWAASASGIIVIASADYLFFNHGKDHQIIQYAIYLMVASVVWWAAAAINLQIVEPDSDAELNHPILEDLREQFKLLKTDKAFRDFLITRSLAIGSGLSSPYIISLAYDQLGGGTTWLGVFIIAEGLAAMLASPLWGRFADRSSRNTLRSAMLVIFALLSLVIGYVIFFSDHQPSATFIFPITLFLLGAAHAGVRVGRKTYLVDMAEGNKRTDYVAVGNTLIGVLLICAGLLTGIASLISVEIALGIFGLCALAGAIYGGKLPPVSKRDSGATASE